MVNLIQLNATLPKARSCSVSTASLMAYADHHDTKSCTATHRRGAACQGTHPSRSNNCKALLQEKERMKKTLCEASIYWSLATIVKPSPQNLSNTEPTLPSILTAAPIHSQATKRPAKKPRSNKITDNNQILSPRALVSARHMVSLPGLDHIQGKQPMHTNASESPPTTNWYIKVLEMEKEARQAEQRHNTILDE